MIVFTMNVVRRRGLSSSAESCGLASVVMVGRILAALTLLPGGAAAVKQSHHRKIYSTTEVAELRQATMCSHNTNSCSPCIQLQDGLSGHRSGSGAGSRLATSDGIVQAARVQSAVYVRV